MKSIFLILFNQKKAFEIIGNDYRDEVHRKSGFIFGFYGIVRFLTNFDSENVQNGLFLNLFDLAFSIGFSILIMAVLSYIIFSIGKRIGGKAEDIDIEATIAHSLIPTIIGVLLVEILKESILGESAWNTIYLRNFILWISWFFSMKITIQGVKEFNDFSWKNSLITVSPIFIIYLGLLGIAYIL